MPIKLIHGSK